MSCSPFDLRDYLLKELSETETRQVDAHVRGCAGCREEVERLRLTEAALFALRDEEIPQRIAFVSDKIFEPSPWRRAWAGFWGSSARLGFASAAMLSIALVVFSLARPAGAPVDRGPATARVIAPAAASETEIHQRVNDIQKRYETNLMIAADDLNWAQRQARLIARSSYGPPVSTNGDSK